MELTMPKLNERFEFLEAFENAAKSAAKAHGFAFSRKDSNLVGHKTKLPFVVRNALRKKKKNSKRDRCPVYIRAVIKYYSMVNSSDKPKWVITKVVLKHNHPMLKVDEIATYPQYHVMSDVVNECACIRLALNEGSNENSTQKLLKLLEECNYIVVPLKTTKGYLTHLFFSHVEAIKCIARCPEVLIVNSTYKTNVYKYPFVSAIGVNNISNKKGALASYQIAIAWIEDENRDQALRNAASKMFPVSNKMLCIWHILEQNLKTNCHKLFKEDDDYQVFKKEVEALCLTLYEENIPELLNTVKKAAEKLHTSEKVIAYINTLMKESNTWISAIWKYLQLEAIETAKDLESVFCSIDQTMRLQHLKASMRLGSNKVAVDPFTLRDPKFGELIGNISAWAINNIKRTLKKIKENPTINKSTEICKCTIKINYKLPCPHIIPMDSPIPLSIINKRWLLERPDMIEFLCPLKFAITDPEFYNTFIKAEKAFQQLPDCASKIEFIAKLDQVVNMPLSEPIKPPQKTVTKGHPSSTKQELLLSEHQDAAAMKKRKS
ncbi:21142_t:CDS:2 [Gigaspora margarita]|uniref:21142_t:CDS:1 n=1 Tax=Gigaspora margarita TaxID=4874 RepID=A0ABN7WJ07_GIGMA|nr:21142_t:CDS:2 [Gigaspora margarita]